MTSQLQFRHILQELNVHRRAFLTMNGWRLLIETTQDERLQISTTVYQGESYIPHSVREAMYTNPLLGETSVRSFVKLHEETYSVTLHYQGGTHDMTDGFPELLEEFSWSAERWYHYLNERDKNDLVYVSHR